MDPSEEWDHMTYFDVDEFGFVMSPSGLQPITDFPANAMFIDGYYAGQDGEPVKLQIVFKRI